MKVASVEMGNLSSGGGDGIRLPDAKPENWIEYFQFKYSRDTASEARDALLVVAALLVQVTFQAGINPPNFKSQNAEFSASSLTVFLVANTLSFSAALTMIEFLTGGMPFQRELRIAMVGLIFVYAWTLGRTLPPNLTKIDNLAISISFMVPYLARFLPNLFKKIMKKT